MIRSIWAMNVWIEEGAHLDDRDAELERNRRQPPSLRPAARYDIGPMSRAREP